MMDAMRALYDVLKKIWLAIGHAIAWFNTRLFLTLIYAIPLGIYAAISALQKAPPASSWVPYPDQETKLKNLLRPF